MSLTARVLSALIAGLVIGVAVSLLETPWMFAAVAAVEPIGALWVNAIRMTVIPLVVSLLVTGIASASGASAGRIGGRAFIWFVVLVAGGAIFTAFAAPPLLSLANFDTAAFAGLRESAPATEVVLPPFRNWIVGLIPPNPVKAAADGAMLPLIVFSCLLALALIRLDVERRQVLVGFFDAIAGAMMVIVGWVLATAPIGVFFLVLPLAANTGVQLVGAFGFFLLVACGLVSVALLALYPVAVVFGGVSLRQFARACAPAQAVAFSTRSSLASLPAMLDSAKRELGLPEQVSSLVLPGAVAVFKYASPVARATGTIFVAHLYGIDLGFVGIATITAAIAGLSFYSPGVPSGGLFVMTPIFVALNLPVEGIGLLIALDLIPDMFITTANVTADLAVATVLGRGEANRVPGAAATEPALTPL
jgi:Na+/H+-dicarboxylate symporter